ncbi:hypothetical protein [Sodalis praecaptivus]|uniref:hypothetical protein n=1 Tax=Sodalis praecaptivus TaxID=1239307 RepID=UPI00280C3AC6|nr:hypothetical protein [Sodalis praecaptivus]
MPPAPRAAAPAPMERTDPERPPQTDNDRRSGDAVTDLGNAAARRQRQPGGGSPATPSPGKAPRGKNRSRHGVKKQQKPEPSSYRQLRYAALNATASEADASTPLPTAALAQGAIPAAIAINGDRPDACAHGYPNYRRGSGAGYRNNFHSDQGAQIRMTSVPWPGAIAGCGWRNMMCMLAASVIDTSAQGSRETRVFSAWTPYWPQPTAGDVIPANETLSGYGNLVGGLWTGTASRGDALPAIGTAFAGAMARTISDAPGGVEKRTAAPGTSTVNGVSGLSDAQEVRAPATTASAALVKREPVGTPPPVQEGTASVDVKGAPVHAAPAAPEGFASVNVKGAPVHAALAAGEGSTSVNVKREPVHAVPAAREGSASVNVKGAPVHAASAAGEGSASVNVKGAPVHAAPAAGEGSASVNVKGVPVHAAPRAGEGSASVNVKREPVHAAPAAREGCASVIVKGAPVHAAPRAGDGSASVRVAPPIVAQRMPPCRPDRPPHSCKTPTARPMA